MTYTPKRIQDIMRGKLTAGGLIFASIGVLLTFRAEVFRHTNCDCKDTFLGVIVAGVGLYLLDPYVLINTWRGWHNGSANDRNDAK